MLIDGIIDLTPTSLLGVVSEKSARSRELHRIAERASQGRSRHLATSQRHDAGIQCMRQQPRIGQLTFRADDLGYRR